MNDVAIGRIAHAVLEVVERWHKDEDTLLEDVNEALGAGDWPDWLVNEHDVNNALALLRGFLRGSFNVPGHDDETSRGA